MRPTRSITQKKTAHTGRLLHKHQMTHRCSAIGCNHLRVPTTSTSTRRFLARPARVEFVATGLASPLPSV